MRTLLCSLFFLCFLIRVADADAKEGSTYGASRQPAFRENKGQVRDQSGKRRTDVLFQLEDGHKSVFISAGEIHYQWNKILAQDSIAVDGTVGKHAQKVESYRLDMRLLGANHNAHVRTEQVLPDVDIYYQDGLNGARAQSFKKITFENIYPNIDWVLYSKDGVLKYDFIVKAGGHVADIKIQYKGATGITLKDGNAVMQTPMGSLTEHKPYSFEQDNGHEVGSVFVLKAGVLSFETQPHSGVLVIDPELRLDWGTYYGGSDVEGGQYLMNTYQGYYAYGNSVTTDNTGAVYLSGASFSTNNIATTGAYQSTFTTGSHAFLVRFDAGGQRLWGTYFSGYSTGDEGTVPGRGHSVVCDTVGNVYLAGNTFCDSGMATPGAHQFYRNSNGYGWPDLYLVKFKNDGSRVWSTYYGNPRTDEGGSLMVKPDGSRIYLAGASEAYPTGQDAIATPGAFIGAATLGSSSYSGFLACFNAAGQRQWGTYLADVTNIISTVYDMASDPQGNLFITGYAISDFPGNTQSISSPGSYQPQYSGCFVSGFGPPLCMVDAFLQKWDADGNRLWGTYYGGDHHDGGYAVACDDAGNAYMTGFTSPFVNANNGLYSVASQGSFMDAFPNEGGAFLAKFSGAGQRQWATYYYGQGTGLACAKDKVFLLVNTAVADKAITCAHQTDNSGIFSTGTSTSAMLSIFNAAGQREYATYYGGKYSDLGFSLSTVVTDDAIQVYLAGNTLSPTGIATAGSFKAALGSQLSIQRDAYVSRFILPLVKKIIVPCFTADSVLVSARDTTLSNYQWSTGAGTKSIWAKRSGLYVVRYERANGCVFTDSFDVTLYPMPRLTTVAACAGQGVASLALPNSSGGLYTYKWYDAQGTLLTESTGQDDVTVGGLAAGMYTCNITTPGCDTTISFTIETFPGLEVTVSHDTSIVAGSSVRLSASGGDSYLWQPAQWLDNPRSASPLATPLASITYTVTGYNAYGCKGTKQVRVAVNDVVLIPNAFSPNGDGLNDEFRITNYGYYKLETFRIFNRWGQEVFFTEDPGKGWNGRYKGLPSDLGTYHYYIGLVDLKGTVQVFKGTLTLVR